jgi:hypothetical protein
MLHGLYAFPNGSWEQGKIKILLKIKTKKELLIKNSFYFYLSTEQI